MFTHMQHFRARFPERKPECFTERMGRSFQGDREFAGQILPMKKMPTQAVQARVRLH